MQTVRIKPAAGLLVRLEDGSGYLAAEGQTVPLTGYWHRRIADGDVEELPAKDDAADEQPATDVATTDQQDVTAAPRGSRKRAGA